MIFALGVMALAVVTAICSATVGTFVVLRREALLVDALSHAVLPGIVLGYLFTHELHSPWVIAGATGAGLLVVWTTDWLRQSGLFAGDAAIGLIFPALFAVGVILVSGRFQHVHLDVDAVLVGDLNLAAFHTITWGGVTVPRFLLVMLGVLAINLLLLYALLPRLTVHTFDPGYAASLGMRTSLLSGIFMTLVALTVTASFYGAGAVLALSFMVIPPATAQLFARSIPQLLWLTAAIAAAGATLGFWIAYYANAPTAAVITVTYGVIFASAWWAQRIWDIGPAQVAREHGTM